MRSNVNIAGLVVLRNMRHASRFSRAEPELTPPITVSLRDGEVLVGWYTNEVPFSGEAIVFTDEAMTYGTASRHRRLAYADVLKVHFPKKELETTHLTIETASGQDEIIIAHSLGARDAYCLALALWSLNGRR